MTSWDYGRSKIPAAADRSAPDGPGRVATGQPRSRLQVAEDAAQRDYDDEPPPDSDGVAQDHPGIGGSERRTSGFRYNRDDADFDEPVYESGGSGFLPATVFFLSMALTGSGASVVWHYYAPDIDLPATTRDVGKLNDSIGQLVQEQRKLTQTINALQLLQDALQKTITAREQDLQQLTAEVRAVRTDLDALRSTAASPPAQHPPLAQAPKRASSSQPPPAKKKVERTTVRPETVREPMELPPKPQ